MREARTLVGMQSLTVESYTVRSTINSKLQRAAEAGAAGGARALRAAARNRVHYEGPEINLGEIIMRVDHRAEHARAAARPRRQADLADRAADRAAAALRRALAGGRGAGAARRRHGRMQIRVGLRDGRIVPLSAAGARRAAALQASTT